MKAEIAKRGNINSKAEFRPQERLHYKPKIISVQHLATIIASKLA